MYIAKSSSGPANPIVQLSNTTVSNNTSGNDGGGVSLNEVNATFVNCTVSENTAGSSGGGINSNAANAILVNCILWNDLPQEIYIESGSVTATYSDIQGGWEGTGNIDADPIFADTANGNYHLLWNSPCIDAGDPDLDGDGDDYTTDTDDQDPDGTRMDMGAYYLHQYQSPLAQFTAFGLVGVGVI